MPPGNIRPQENVPNTRTVHNQPEADSEVEAPDNQGAEGATIDDWKFLDIYIVVLVQTCLKVLFSVRRPRPLYASLLAFGFCRYDSSLFLSLPHFYILLWLDARLWSVKINLSVLRDSFFGSRPIRESHRGCQDAAFAVVERNSWPVIRSLKSHEESTMSGMALFTGQVPSRRSQYRSRPRRSTDLIRTADATQRASTRRRTCPLLRAIATLTPSLVVHPALDYASTMAMREDESALLYDLHWSQEPFDGGTDLPLIDVPAQQLEIGHNRFSADQLRCANNCSADWGSIFDDAMRSRNFRRVHLRERQLFFELNRRWVIPDGPQKKEHQANRLRVWIEVMWYFHMMRRLRFGLCAPDALAPSPYHIERLTAPTPAAPTLPQQQSSPSSSTLPQQQQPCSSSSEQLQSRSAGQPASSPNSSASASGSTNYVSRVLPALDAEMDRMSQPGPNSIPIRAYTFNEDLLNDPSVVPVAERLERLERRQTKIPRPIDTRHPFYLRNPRIAPYPFPVPPRPVQARTSQQENVRLLAEAMTPRPTIPAVHYSGLGWIPSSSSTSTLQSMASSSTNSSSDTAPTEPNSPVSKPPPRSYSTASHSTPVNVLLSVPTDPVELLSRLGSRSSPGVASKYGILIACLKRVLPDYAVTRSCQFLVDELTPAGIARAHADINSLERVANRFREVVGGELTVRRDALRRRESSLVSDWEDEYLANLRQDKELEAEASELLHGRRPSPTPPPSPRHQHPYFVSSQRLSGLRAPPTSRIGPAPSRTGTPSSTRPGSPTPPASEVDGVSSRKRRRFTLAPPSSPFPPAPPPSPPIAASTGSARIEWDDTVMSSFNVAPPSSPFPPAPPPSPPIATSTGSGPIEWDDTVMSSVDPDEPDVDEDKVIGSAFYQDLARDISIDPSIDSAMVRTLTRLAEGTPEDVLNKCVDAMIEENTS
ncbi:hypothetical protein BDZ89DRAFT_1051587 [Hymenopellis radicata]|nr:hypothetical protein BDZ89DRAFT_1051587 [Hymenopellis radicata]